MAIKADEIYKELNNGLMMLLTRAQCTTGSAISKATVNA